MTTNDLEKTLAAVQERLDRLEAERRPLRLRRTVWGALVVLVGGTAMAAAVWPANFLPDDPARAADMNDYFNDLKASTVPAGAIVFFGARPLNGTPCPPGWSQYAIGNGRLIVGTGSSGIGLPSGGAPLSSGEIRTHNHVWARQDSANRWLSFDGGGFPLEIIDWAGGMNEGTGAAYYPLATSTALAGVARDWWTAMGSSNLPYIQLLACQKD